MSNLIVDNIIITTPLETILKDLQSELHNGKLSSMEFKGEDIRVSCPFHKNGLEEHASCGIYNGDDPKIGVGVFHCFTCGEKGPFFHFVAACMNKDDEYAKSWLKDNYGSGVMDDYLVLPEISVRESGEIIHPKYLKKDILEDPDLQSWHPYLAKRKLSQEICERFQVKYSVKQKCIVFPVYDETSKLWMLTKRSVLSKHFYIENDKEKPLYLYYYIKEQNIKEVTICESQINALTLWSWGIPAIAMFGTGTEHQYDLINKSSLKHIYLALDGDAAGDAGTLRFLKNVQDIFIDVIEIPKGKDVNDLTKEEFNKLSIVSSNDWIFKIVGINLNN